MTWEDDDAPADFDFDDCVVYIEQGSGFQVLPVQRTTWGAIKSRFR